MTLETGSMVQQTNKLPTSKLHTPPTSTVTNQVTTVEVASNMITITVPTIMFEFT